MNLAKTEAIPWGPLGFVTFKRTYARRLDSANPKGPSEEFDQTIDRVLDACEAQLKVGFTSAERAQAKRDFLSLKGMVAGRFLWQLGTTTVDKLGLFSLQNCAFTIVDEPIAPFVWTFDALMLGSGVGFNLQRHHVAKLPVVKGAHLIRTSPDKALFVVPDNREGWIELLSRVLEAHFFSGQTLSYSTDNLRAKGTPIKGFGGVASGPDILAWGMEEISKILNTRVGQKLRPIDALDVMNIIGQVVVSGNVRRSAQLAIGDADDLEFLNSKRWDKGSLPNWRAMSNNSVVCSDTKTLPEEFWEGYMGQGEPFGLINLALAKKTGRLGDTRYPDPDVEGFNPCGEQPLAPNETCALAELFLPNITSFEELERVAKTLYRIVKHSLALPCHQKSTETIVHKHMRMGIGVTGYLQASEQQRQWLPKLYEALRAYDVEYSKLKGWPQSIKLTTCKPSGTLSLLAGVTPGIHPGFAQYFIRRIRMSTDSDLVGICRTHGYPVEPQRNFDGSRDPFTSVVSFPCSYPEGTLLARNLTAIKQLEWVKRMQTEWSDNAVSCTVYYRKQDIPEIRAWLDAHFSSSIKSVSFLLHNEHGFAQAPYEEISKEQFEALTRQTRPISSINTSGEDPHTLETQECDTELCPVR